MLISNDGRNFIYTTDEKFDVIISEPSNPWLTGVANLFTLEYFKRGAAALTDDGIFSQWLQLYEMSPEDMKTLIVTRARDKSGVGGNVYFMHVDLAGVASPPFDPEV